MLSGDTGNTVGLFIIQFLFVRIPSVKHLQFE